MHESDSLVLVVSSWCDVVGEGRPTDSFAEFCHIFVSRWQGQILQEEILLTLCGWDRQG
jgi:hypothetical protein